MSSLRAADNYKQRPTSMILHDPYALHRKWWDEDWVPVPGVDDAWTDWDYLLAEVYQLIGDYTDDKTGQWMPFDQSGDVYWDVKSIFSGSAAAIEKYEKNRTELEPGESLYTVPIFKGEKPTLRTWMEDVANERADLRPVEAINARPPTPAELAAMNGK